MKLSNKTNNSKTTTMKKFVSKTSFLLVSAFILLASCTKPTTDMPVYNKGNTVTGVVKDNNGNPIAGANVRAENDVINTFSEGTTDANGRYSLPIEFVGR